MNGQLSSKATFKLPVPIKCTYKCSARANIERTKFDYATESWDARRVVEISRAQRDHDCTVSKMIIPPNGLADVWVSMCAVIEYSGDQINQIMLVKSESTERKMAAEMVLIIALGVMIFNQGDENMWLVWEHLAVFGVRII